MKVKLNLLAKDSGDSASRSVEVTGMCNLHAEHSKFLQESKSLLGRCYPDHEFLEGTISEQEAFDAWNDEL